MSKMSRKGVSGSAINSSDSSSSPATPTFDLRSEFELDRIRRENEESPTDNFSFKKLIPKKNVVRRLQFNSPIRDLACEETIPDTPVTLARKQMEDDSVDSPWVIRDIFNKNNVRCCVGDINEGAGSSKNIEKTSTFIPIHELQSGHWKLTDKTITRPKAAIAAAPPSTTLGAAGISHTETSGYVQKGGKRKLDVTVTKSNKKKKPGKLFFVTIQLAFKPDLTERSRLIANVEIAGYKLITYCVAAEVSEVSSAYSYHLHAFFEFEELIFVEELCKYLQSVYDGVNVDVRPCRSKKACLKYISQEDIWLYTNVKVSSLHFNYRCYNWAKNIRKFDHTHPFVTEHRFCYKFLKNYYEDFVKNSVGKFGGLREFNGTVYKNWMLDVVSWWNECVRAIQYDMWGTKRKQLYIFGNTNVGKSTLI